MSATTGYTVFFSEHDAAGRHLADYLLTENGLLYATFDHGTVWRCLGLVEVADLLVHFGLLERGPDDFVSESRPAPRPRSASPTH